MSAARLDEFLARLAEVLEVPAITAGDDYRETPLWGSLTCFAVKVMLMQQFGVELTLQTIGDCPSAGALAEKVIG